MKKLLLLIGISLALVSVSAQDRDGRAIRTLATVTTGATTYVAIDMAGRCQFSWVRFLARDLGTSATDSIKITAKWCKRKNATRDTLWVNNSDSITLTTTDSGKVKSYSGSSFQPPAATGDSLHLMLIPRTGNKVGNAISCSVWVDCRYGN